MPIVYRIDGQNRICFVNEAWTVFAQQNQGSHLSRDQVLGTSLWKYLTGTGTRYLYVQALEFVRETGTPLSFELRCDAPAIRRNLHMVVSRLEDHAIQFETTTLQEVERPAVELLNVTHARDTRIVPLCGWCMQAQNLQLRWIDLEQAAQRIEMSVAGTLPEVIHTVCPACHHHLRKQMIMPAGTMRSDW